MQLLLLYDCLALSGLDFLVAKCNLVLRFVFQIILTSSKFIEKSETYRYLRPWLNDGLLLSSGIFKSQIFKGTHSIFAFFTLSEFNSDSEKALIIQFFFGIDKEF